MGCKHHRLTNHDDIRAGIDLWNRMHSDFVVPNRLIAQNVFAPFDRLDVTAWGAVDDDLVGFALGKCLTRSIPDYAGPEQGWISLFAVDPARQDRQAVASNLLATIEEAMAKQGVSHLRFGGDPGQFLPGLPTDFTEFREVLDDRGFETRGEVYDLQREIGEFSSPSRVDEVRISWSELTLERANGNTTDTLLQFLDDQFPGRWRYEALNICQLPGGAADYWLLDHEGTTVGFARTNTPDSIFRGGNVNWEARLTGNVCGLGPLGIHESYRGHGWGLWLIATLAERYRDAGYDRMVIDWTDLLDYYGQLGFERWLTYETRTKEVSA